MRKNTIALTTIEQQIEKLEKQNLKILDKHFAKEMLELYGYSNLVKSYRDPYMMETNDMKKYRDGAKFEQILSLYILDRTLRSAVISAMLDLEERVKSAAADVIAQSFGVDHEQYLQFKNYRDKAKSKYRFSLAGILKTLKSTLNTGKNPIAHYREKYNTVPPWILFKGTYLGTMINFINLFKPNEQWQLATRLYNPGDFGNYNEDIRYLMMDTFFICLEYRNIAAHGGRIYNYHTNSKSRYIEKYKINVSGFSELLYLMNLMRYKAPYDTLKFVLEKELKRHYSLFPEDITYLSSILNLTIKRTPIVWISEKSTVYHCNEHCSGMNNAHHIPLFVAEENGFIPCKKCC